MPAADRAEHRDADQGLSELHGDELPCPVDEGGTQGQPLHEQSRQFNYHLVSCETRKRMSL